MKTKITGSLTILLISVTVLANDITHEKIPVISGLNMKIGAYASFESGFSKENHLKKSEKNISANKEKFAFFNDNAIFTTISNKADDITYGAKIILVPTTKRKVNKDYNGSYVFLENNYGRIEAGSPIPVAKNMMISDGFIPIKYIKTNTEYLKQHTKTNPSFLIGQGCFLGDSIVAGLDLVTYSNEPPRTINYYTPKLSINDSSKIQLGISYTPDTANTGMDNPSVKSDKKKEYRIGISGIDRFEIDRSIKDAVTIGLSLEQKFAANVELKLTTTGEYGKSVGKIKKFANKQDKTPQEYRLHNLESFNIGAELKVNNFKYNACYGSFGRSFTSRELHKAGLNTHYYNAGAAYKYNATTITLSYFGSEQFKNKVDSVKLNVSHLLAPGLKPYVELHNYTLKGKPEFYSELKARRVKGVIALIGIKLTL